ncbi:MAG: T9SS type A sorting domain-containing protein [Bacteroidia bacterium]|nr:T9SS type A sorting domain-containing protein [Bacteroidia bacterium]
MKNRLCLFLLFFVPFFSFAQQRTSAPDRSLEQRRSPLPTQLTRVVQDTLLPTSFSQPCGSSVLTYLSVANWGFVSGTNGYGDKEKAERLDYSTNADVTIEEIWAFFSVAVPVGNGIVSYKLYDVTAGGGPGNLLGNTVSSRVSGLGTSDTSVIATVFPVLNTVTLSGKTGFFASLDISGIYATNDTVGLFSTETTCGDNSSTWELFDDNTWHNFNDSTTSWGLTLDLYVAAVISFDETSGIDDYVHSRGLSIFPAFPSPATSQVQLPFELASTTSVKVAVYDMQGRQISQQDLGLRAAGKHAFEVNTRSFTPGMYTYVIQSGEASLASRFLVE